MCIAKCCQVMVNSMKFLCYLTSCCKPTINHIKQDCPQWRDIRKKYNIQGDIVALLGKNFEVEKMMRFLKETEMFEEI